MRYPRARVPQVRSSVISLTGGIKEGVSQLEMKPGELIDCINYQEIDGAYHGYSSITGYERTDGQQLASDIPIDFYLDSGLSSRTLLLLESDSKGTVEDLSYNKLPITPYNVIDDPNDKQLLSSSYYFDTSSVIEVAHNPILNLTDSEFTIDFRAKIADTSYEVFIEKLGEFKISVSLGKLYFSISEDGITYNTSLASTTALTADEWHLISFIRKDNSIYLFIDGVKDDTIFDSYTIFSGTNSLKIGESLTYDRMDEIRVSKGVLFFLDYDVPTTPYSDGSYELKQVDDSAREAQRALISPVPGIGVSYPFILSGNIFAIRDSLTSGGSEVYIESPTSWQLLPGADIFEYINGSDTNDVGFEIGDTVTGGTSGATGYITGSVKSSGDWVSGSTTGKLCVDKESIDFVSGEIITSSSGVTADISTISTYVGNLDGTPKIKNGRFDALHKYQRKSISLIVDGAGYPRYTDGSIIHPIIHNNLPDAEGVFASSVAIFKDRLFLGYPDGRLWYSGVFDPLNYDTATGGAGYKYIGDEITDLYVSKGDALIIFCRNSIKIMKSIADANNPELGVTYSFSIESFSEHFGAIENTVKEIQGELLYLDDRGLTSLYTTNEFGDFATATISKNIQKTLLSKMPLVTTSGLNRKSNQYRLFFSDYYGLIFTFNAEKKVKGITKIFYNHAVSSFAEGEDLDGTFMMLFGNINGYIYRMDSGTSFDGDYINTKIETSYYHYSTPTTWKKFYKVTIEAAADRDTVFIGQPNYNYKEAYVPSTEAQEYVSIGSGGIYGIDTYGTFQYGASEVQNPVLFLNGYGVNMNMTIKTQEKYVKQHVLNSMIVEKSFHNRKM